MTAREPIVSEDKQLRDLYLDFELDKTYKKYFEAGSILGKAFLTYLLLLSFSAILALDKGIGNDVKVPFLEVPLNKRYAALIVLALGAGALYWYLSTLMITQLVNHKLTLLIRERYGVSKASKWNWAYPSAYHTFSTVNLTRKPSVSILLDRLFGFVTLMCCSLLPLIVAWKIALSFEADTRYKILMCVIILVLYIPNINMFRSLTTKKIELRTQELDKYRGRDDRVPIDIDN
jgi:hypothetical protein